MIPAGDLREVVTFEQPTLAEADEFGHRDQGWSEYARGRANIRPVAARELEQAKSLAATCSRVITIRYLAELRTTHRIVCDGQVFSIDGFYDEDRRRTDLKVFCTTVQENT